MHQLDTFIMTPPRWPPASPSLWSTRSLRCRMMKWKWASSAVASPAPVRIEEALHFRPVIDRINHRIGFRFGLNQVFGGNHAAMILAVTQQNNRLASANGLQHIL